MKKMWQPKSVGAVIAAREYDLRRGRRRVGKVRVSFGRPVRARRPEPGDPWWCPVQLTGPGLDLLRPIAGLDSLQALTLALEVAPHLLQHEAASRGGRIEWLGEEVTFPKPRGT